MIGLLWFLICLLVAILVHEAGHLIVALLCGVRVEAFSIGFGKPIWHKKIRGIDFRITPFLLGGYTQLYGETDKIPGSWLNERYLKKFAILVAGVLMNFLVACICYWFHYKSILYGIMIDWHILVWIFTKNTSSIALLMVLLPNLFLLQMSLINFMLAIFNILPIPALDGGWIWMLAMEKRVKNFIPWLKKTTAFWFIMLMVLQLFLVLYVFWG